MPACAACGARNPEQARFCQACGDPLAGTVRRAPEERRIVTALFCDLVGFTSRSDLADPEDVMARLRPFYRRVRADIEAFGGTVQKFIGDAVVGAFGARVAHEDDPERAVRAALRILESIDELNRATPGLDLSVRVGVNTGEVVVPTGPTSEDNEILAIGDAVNVASRLQTVAAGGTVAVGRSTHEATQRIFVYESLEPVAVKGKAQPLEAWRAVEPLARIGADVNRSLTGPFVGRQPEFELLRNLFARAAQDATPQLVTIIGDAGVGKSRLVGELFRHVEARPELIAWRQGRCLPYGEGITFWALAEIVKAHLGIRDTDTPESAEAKLDSGLQGADPERQWMKIALAPLVGLELGAPGERDELFTAWRRFLESICLAGPAVLVIEDLHWADEAMIAFLDELMRRVMDVPLLLLCTARPELLDRFPHWPPGSRNATMLSLRPLTEAQTEQLLAELGAPDELSQSARESIVERVGGNPLYANEYVRLLRDRRETMVLGEALPRSVQAIIAARLDTLAPAHRAIVQSAAVVGKVFWASAVRALDGMDQAAVDEGLLELTRRELVHRSRSSSMEGEQEYAFWHVVLPEVAYQQLPRAVRAERHAALVRWLEQRVGPGSVDLSGVLAHHATQALELTRASGGGEDAEVLTAARKWLSLAGDRALALDVADAERLYARALDLTPADHPERGPLLVRVADAARQAGRYGSAASAFEQAVGQLQAKGDHRAAGRASVLAANVLRHMNDARADEVLAAGLTLLEGEPPGPELVDAYAEVAGHEYVLGSFARSVEWADKALDLAERLTLTPSMRALGFRGASRCLLGDVAGLEDMHEALSLGLGRGAGRDTALVYANLAGVSWLIEGPEASWKVYEEGVQFARHRGITEFALITEAASLEALFDMGRWDEVLALVDRLDQPLEASGAALDLLWLRTVKAHVLAERGDFDDASAIVDGMAPTVREYGGAQLIVPTFTVSAMCHAARHRLPETSRLVEEMVAIAGIGSDPNCLPYLPTLAGLAVACGRTGDAERLAGTIGATTARHRAVRGSVGAIIAEAHQELEVAARGYARAGEQWAELGVVLEEAAALGGQGRCLARAGRRPEGATLLAAAGEMFMALDARSRVAEVGGTSQN